MGARDFFASLEERADTSKIEGIDHSYLFDVAGEGEWLVEVRGGTVTVSEGPADADVTIACDAETFDRIAAGQQNPVLAYMSGKVKISGDTAAALKLQKIF
ncbi:MAG: SCP2 sterol-binding domain-containing protein [Actinobacteria bacterium]|nr:SCP2 sterol-binding domain-containing protein [Actinomycetota bacterium]MBV8396821.1 SCP2 sterol-binding domain-containing protein [Actinomycetota bacterium]MBV8598590.1 SCP2 sterol-binding domain-containing protein [Actinomycetota bacterium]